MEEKKFSFEDGMKRLETIVRTLEAGEGSLEEMIGLYEEGTLLHKKLSGVLDGYEKRLTVISEEE